MIKMKPRSISDSSISIMNLSCIITSVLITVAYLFFRRRVDSFFDYDQLVYFISLSTILVSGPFFFRTYLKLPVDKWYTDESVLSIIILLFLGLLGYLLHFTPFLDVTRQVLAIVAIGLLFAEFMNLLKGPKRIEWILIPLLFTVLALVIYIQGTQDIFYFEQVWLGQAQQDSLFHMAISNLLNTTGVPTLGLHGIVELKYHWLSHWLFAGLNNLSGQQTVLFYNLGYVVIFIPIFIKALYLVSSKYLQFRYQRDLSLLFFAIAIVLMNSFLNVRAWSGVEPFISESFGLSLSLSFLYLTSLIAFVRNKPKNSIPFFLYSICIVSLILLAKISTGMVLLSGLSLLFVLNYKVKYYPILIIAIIYFAFFTKEVVAVSDSTIVAAGFFERLDTMLKRFLTPLSLFGAFLFLCHWISLKEKNIAKGVWSNLNNEYGFLLVQSVTGFILAIYVSFSWYHSFYFGSVQFFIAFPIIISFMFQLWERFQISKQHKTLLLVVFTFFALSYHYETLRQIEQQRKVQVRMIENGDFDPALRETINLLMVLDSEESKSNKILFLDNSVKDLFKSEFILADFFVPSALSGIPSIGGIRESFNLTKQQSYGLGDYSGINGLYINSLEEAKSQSRAMGYKELIYFEVNNDNKVTKQSYVL
ncbi:hypothetical protein [Roseivirga sp.]|uniref:hypothetical protein n=1 Tax=Roseivirga sp. TaxID=1964215 RepID=UPI002B26B4C3|nr:hypothetical protein [Roseivirga sp.]